MPQVQMKVSYIPMTISCDHCLQEQIVHMKPRPDSGKWRINQLSV